jgi:hypothetical protein
MFKGRIRLWGFNKNIREGDWEALAKLHKIRKDRGKRSTEFLVHGKKKTVADLCKHIKSKDMSEDEFLTAALNSAIPDHVRSYTPDPEEPERSLSQSSSEEASTPSSTNSGCPDALHLSPATTQSYLSPPNETSSMSRYGSSHGDIPTPSTKITEFSQPDDGLQPENPHNDDSDYVIVPREIPQFDDYYTVDCDQVQQDVVTMASQLVQPTSLMTSYGAEDVPSFRLVQATPPPDSAWQPPCLCSKCHRPSSAHFISLDRLAPPETVARDLLNESQGGPMALPSTTRDYDAATRWVARCFLACIYKTRGQIEFGEKSLAEAATAFESMLVRRDGLILTALHLMVTILHQHDQGEIAKSIVHSATEVAERILGPEDPLKLILQFEEAASDLKLRQSSIRSVHLRKIFVHFEEELTIKHPWTLAALYNLAWMLLWEGSYSEDEQEAQELYIEAEGKLQRLYKESCSSLSHLHMQSITALTALSRAQYNQGRKDAAIETMLHAINDCKYTLGRSHPFRLEAKRRLAVFYGETGRKEKMEELYWDVLHGRLMMLGRNHPWTDDARKDLTNLLKELGKWDEDGEAKWKIDELFEKTSESSSQHEAF